MVSIVRGTPREPVLREEGVRKIVRACVAYVCM